MSKFKEGDNVFCVARGFGVITEEVTGVAHSLCVQFKDDFSKGRRTPEGFTNLTDAHPSLFHSPQEAAEYFSKIKKKEKRVIKAWVNIYLEKEPVFHTERHEADKYALNNRIACIPIEQEVEFEV